jgi:hypothetical protein
MPRPASFWGGAGAGRYGGHRPAGGDSRIKSVLKMCQSAFSFHAGTISGPILPNS